MTAQELTDAEAERVARFEAASEPEEITVERVARAIHQEQNRGAKWELAFGHVHDEYRRLAVAAIAALAPQDDDGPRAGIWLR